MHLATTGWLAHSNNPRSYTGRSLMLLAGPTKLDRSLGEGPDEARMQVLKARGFGSGLTTKNCKKRFCYRKSNEDTNYNCKQWPSSLQRLVWMAVVKAERKLLTERWKSWTPKQRPGLDSGMFVPCMRLWKWRTWTTMGYNPQAGQWQTGVKELRCCPICQLAWQVATN